MELSRITLLGVSALVLITTVYAHGTCSKPCARGACKSYSLTIPPHEDMDDVDTDDCPHCLNGGGKGAVMEAANNNWRPWEPLKPGKFRHDSGLCGDPIKDPTPRAHERGGRFGPSKITPYMAVYKKNQIVEFTVDVTTNHNGFFEFFVCDVGKCGGDINEKCFKNGHCHQLMRAKVPECENSSSKECGPIDPDYPGRWVVPCRKGAHVGEHFMGGHFMQYHLPKNFACQDCVIQWYWATANSCNPPGFKEYFEKYPMKKWDRCPGDGGAQGGRNPVLATCGGKEFPEEFWTCMDVRVTGNGVRLPSNAPKEVETRKFVPDTATLKKGGSIPIVDTTDPTPKPKPTPSNSPRPRQQQRPVSGAQTAKDCTKKVEMREPGELTPDPKKAKCASNWKQCGGIYFDGPTECCSSDFECYAINKYFAQCKAIKKRH